MATRCGDIDAAVIPYLEQRLGLSGSELVSRLNHECGLLGVSGISGDMRVLLEDSSASARFAVELYCYRARKYIGAFCAVLGGCDGIVFGGGAGEHLPAVRQRILEDMRWAGVELDPRANALATQGEACISAPVSAVAVRVIQVDEESSLARAAQVALSSHE
jgi:acetate kinase